LWQDSSTELQSLVCWQSNSQTLPPRIGSLVQLAPQAHWLSAEQEVNSPASGRPVQTTPVVPPVVPACVPPVVPPPVEVPLDELSPWPPVPVEPDPPQAASNHEAT